MASFRFTGYGFNQGDCSIFGNPPAEFHWTRSGSKICVLPRQEAGVQYGCPGVDFSIDGVEDGGASKKLKIWITPEGGEEFFWGEFSYGASQCWEERVPYDCLNGACLKSSEYKTPGLYQSLEECETACGTGCSGKCLSNNDWNKIKDLAQKLKNKSCN